MRITRSVVLLRDALASTRRITPRWPYGSRITDLCSRPELKPSITNVHLHVHFHHGCLMEMALFPVVRAARLCALTFWRDDAVKISWSVRDRDRGR